MSEGGEVENEKTTVSDWPKTGVVSTDGGRLNVRKEPNTSSIVFKKLNNGTEIKLTGYADGWYSVTLEDCRGYVSSEYVNVTSEGSKAMYTVTFTVPSEGMLNELRAYLNGMGLEPTITEAGD